VAPLGVSRIQDLGFRATTDREEKTKTTEVRRPIKSYRDLLVWQRGMDLVPVIYALSERLPPRERFGLISQMQRAAVSVPTNIAEGHARKRTGDFLRHLSIAAGSLAEVETLLQATVRLRYLKEADIESALQKTDELGRMLQGLIRKLEARRPWIQNPRF
jgi:four helix bundle protein